MNHRQIKGDMAEILRTLVDPFFDQGTSPVYVSTCCARLFVGEVAPVKCRGCGREPSVRVLTAKTEVPSVVDLFEPSPVSA